MHKTTKYIFLALVAIAGFWAGEEIYLKKEQNQDTQKKIQVAENTNSSDPSVWDKTKDVTSDVWDGTKNVASDVWDGTKKVTSDVWDGTKEVGSDIKEGISGDESKTSN